MKKYLKSASVLLLILVMTFTMVACKKPPMVTQAEIDKAVEEGEAEGEITFTYSPAATSADYKQAADKFVTAFEQKYTNVTVERDYTATSDNRIASADIGDVFYFAETQTYKYAVQDSALLPLDGFMTKFGINQSDVYSGIYALGLVNGRLYFVPRDYNQIVLIYNKSAITEAGLSSEIKPEWTWEEFQSICEQLYDPEGDYYPLNLNLTYSPVYVPFFEAYASRDAWCNTTDKRITFIDENGDILRAIGEALDMARKYYVMIPSVNESAEDIVGREYIFKTDVYPTIQGVGKQFDNRNIINMPLFQNPSFGCGASGVGVFARTQNVTAAAALALFFLTPEGQRAFNSGTGGSVPLLKSLDDEGYDAWKYPDDPAWSGKNWDAFVYMADTASTPGQVNCRMPIDVAEAIEADIRNIFTRDLAGTESYQDGFRELETRCNEIWSLLTV